MNEKGFTLVEIIATIAVLALLIVITVPIIGNISGNIKKNTLQTKINNIKKAAILYGQDNRDRFKINSSNCSYCNGATNCYCFGITSKEKITVNTLLDEDKIKEDVLEVELGTETKHILNSFNDEAFLDTCEIQLYEKYGKIYAVYEKTISGTENLETCYYE